MELTGTIKVILEEKEITAKFRVRELVLETDDTYPQLIAIQFANDRVELIGNLSVGQKVTVGINIRGREWTSPDGEVKYFTNIDGWKVSVADASRPAPSGGAGGGGRVGGFAGPSDGPEDDSIPFSKIFEV